jgi:hypothetical protein
MPDDPFQPLIDQLADLMKLAEENAGKSLEGPVPAGLEQQLAFLEEWVEGFKKICKAQIAVEGKASVEETVRKFRENPGQFSPNEQKLIRDFLRLGLNAVILRAGLARARRGVGKGKEREVSKNTQKSIQKRRRKFRGMGPETGWQKL